MQAVASYVSPPLGRYPETPDASWRAGTRAPEPDRVEHSIAIDCAPEPATSRWLRGTLRAYRRDRPLAGPSSPNGNLGPRPTGSLGGRGSQGGSDAVGRGAGRQRRKRPASLTLNP